MIGCKNLTEMNSSINEEEWGAINNKSVSLITLTNKNGMQVKISNFGGIISYIAAPDKNNTFENVVLGFDSLYKYVAENYLAANPYFGAIIGRYANRIAKGSFSLNGSTYQLALNDGVNTLHGGPGGFHTRVFNIDSLYAADDSIVVELSYVSPDMEEGYPGNLNVKVNYTLTASNEIKIDYEAETDKPTVINLTNHSYFNLTGLKESVLNHEIMIVADSITPTDSTLIPTGILVPVTGTAYDFNIPKVIGNWIDEIPGGYDINYKLHKKEKNKITLAAEVYDPVSGRLLQVYTNEPGIQFYSGNFLDGRLKDSNGRPFQKYYGLCLEAQHFPDSPNKPQFPNVILLPGEKYNQTTIYKFSIR